MLIACSLTSCDRISAARPFIASVFDMRDHRTQQRPEPRPSRATTTAPTRGPPPPSPLRDERRGARAAVQSLAARLDIGSSCRTARSDSAATQLVAVATQHVAAESLAACFWTLAGPAARRRPAQGRRRPPPFPRPRPPARLGAARGPQYAGTREAVQAVYSSIESVDTKNCLDFGCLISCAGGGRGRDPGSCTSCTLFCLR